MNTIQKHWNEYRDEVLPKEAGPVQVSECRIAFYAGAMCMTLINEDISRPEVSEEAGVAILQGIEQELSLYVDQLVKELKRREYGNP